MKKMIKCLAIEKILSGILMFAIFLSIPILGVSAEETSNDASVDIERSLLWSRTSDDGKYPRHRIPGIVVTKKDTVIVYCEARTGNREYSLYDKDDWCLMDVYIQRSTDGGKTFGDPIYIAYGTPEYATINNPVIIVGNDNTLHFLYCRNYAVNNGGIWYRKSVDDGLTWSEPRELTSFVDSIEFSNFAFGPGHGICTRDGILMSPVWTSGPSHSWIFYSDDNGETWKMSEPASENYSETVIAQLSDGSIMLNSRATPYRKVTISANGINKWSQTKEDKQLPDPACCGGMVSVDLEGLPYALLFVNCASTVARNKVTLRCSFDDGNTFSKNVMICENEGGYSDVAIDSKGQIYVIYEVNMGGKVYLAKLDFYDAFCADEAEVLTSTQTVFDLKGENAVGFVTESRNVEVSHTEESLYFSLNQSTIRRLTLDFSTITKNLNLSDFGAIAIKARLNTQMEQDMTLELSLRYGRFLNSSNQYFDGSVHSNNEFQTIVFDLSSVKDLEGMFRSMQLEIRSDAGLFTEGDSLEIASVAFCANAEEATTVFSSNDTEQTDDSNKTNEKRGCKSAAGKLSALGMIAVVPTFWKRKKKSHRSKLDALN